MTRKLIMTKGSITGAYVFWDKVPEVRINRFDRTVMWIDDKSAKKVVPDMYNFEKLFPKLAIPGEFGMMEVEIEEVENGYLIKEKKSES